MNECMQEKTCCFSGHRLLSTKEIPTIKARLHEEIQKLIDRGFEYFLCGGAIGFDTLAAKAVIELRKTNPQIKLILVQPCNNQDELWNLEQKGDYALISLMSDKVLYANNEYHDGCMRYRNRRLVNDSVVCLCYCLRVNSGTSYTVNYAKEREREIINLAE